MNLHSIYFLFYFIIIFTSVQSCTQESATADLIITNAKIWTGNDAQAFAESMIISADTILAIGNSSDIIQYKNKHTTVIDVDGRFITPGFIDSHVHLLMGGNSLLSVQLRDADTPTEFTKRIADYANTLEDEMWILEGNWDHTLWGGELPKKEWIDEVTSENPVVIFRLDGHMVLANSLALKIAGIDQNTVDIEGGEIVRDTSGTPTGILKGNAMIPVLDKIPPMTETHKFKAFRSAMKYFSSNGVTSVHDVDSLSCYHIANSLLTKKELDVRIYNIHPLTRWSEISDIDFNNNKWLRRGGLKGFVDGSLGSHTAAFHDHYTDQEDDKGLLLYDEEQLYEWILQADKSDLQVMVHAIGDKANHSILNMIEKLIRTNGKKDRRFRIEHAQHISEADINRFAALHVIASMQPYHAIDDGRWAEEVIGRDRIQTTYAFKSLLDHNTQVAFGSDWAVAPASPILGIYAATTRRTLDDKNPNGWVPDQKISVEQALRAYTITAAYASFEEDIKGSLEVGKLADFVILSEDITKINPIDIKDVIVLETYVGGKSVFQSSLK